MSSQNTSPNSPCPAVHPFPCHSCSLRLTQTSGCLFSQKHGRCAIASNPTQMLHRAQNQWFREPPHPQLDLSGNPLTAASSPVLLRFARQNLLMQNVWLAGTQVCCGAVFPDFWAGREVWSPQGCLSTLSRHQVPQDVVSEIADVLRNRRKKTLRMPHTPPSPPMFPCGEHITHVFVIQ